MEDTNVIYEVMRDQANFLIATILNKCEDRGGYIPYDKALNMMLDVKQQCRNVPTRDADAIERATVLFVEERRILMES